MPRVYSFDVYDTCVTRTFARPTDLWIEAARRVLADAQGSPAEEAVQELSRLRLEAEKLARRQCGAEDLTLDAIYACFDGENPWGVSGAALMAAEVELETDSTRAVPAIRERIDGIRAAGGRIVFVTDMYLPAKVIRAILARHGLLREGDGLYVSGELGLTKTTGTLFTHVLRREGVAPSDMVHVGDNPRGDVRSPTRLGIKAMPCRDAALTPLEARLADRVVRPRPRLSALAGACRLARLRAGSEAGSPLAILAADVIAPALAAFVAWTLRDAAASGINRLHFVARDGQILHRMAMALARPGLDPECRYLYGSRQAWFLPSIDSIDRDDLDWLVVPGHSRRPADILRRLGLAPADLPDDLGDSPLDQRGVDALWQLLARPAVRELVLARAEAARESTLAYLRQEGVADGPVVLVDVGWTLKAQRALRRILAHAGSPAPEVYGYYWGVAASRLPASESGPYRAFLIERPPHLDPGAALNPLFRNCNLIEQVFTAADHGQVLGYRSSGGRMEPILGPGPSPDAARRIRLVQAVAVGLAEELAERGFLHEDGDELMDTALSSLRSFMAAPPAGLAACVAQATVGDDQNESRKRVLARPVTALDLARLALGRAGLVPMPAYERTFDWIEGSIALSAPWLRPLLRQKPVFELLRQARKSC